MSVNPEANPEANPPNPRHPRQRTQVEEGHRFLKCFYDLDEFYSPDSEVIASQVVFVLLSYDLR